MAPASPPTPPPLDEALSVWRDACARRDAGSPPQEERDPGEAEELQEAEEAAAEAVQNAAEEILGRIRKIHTELAALLPRVNEALDALLAVAEREELLEERTARHGELAGVSYRGRERVEEIEGIRSCIEQAAASLEEALESR
jgi:hypothetical protein